MNQLDATMIIDQ